MVFTTGMVTLGTTLPLTMTVMIMVLFGPGLNTADIMWMDRITALLDRIDSKGAVRRVWKESIDIDERLIVVGVVSPWDNDRHGIGS